MFLTLFVFLMKFADISKLHSQRCPSGDACNKTACWQHVARMQHLQQQQQQQKMKSNSSSTSSGCDSNASTSTTSTTSSSKENCFMPTTPIAINRKTKPAATQQQSITPQQLNELRYYQQMQAQHLHILQQQLLQRRRLQQNLRTSTMQRHTSPATATQQINNTTTATTLTCNQQYLMQQRLQQQQQFFNLNNIYNNNKNNNNGVLNDHDTLNNNNNNNYNNNNNNNYNNNNNNNDNWNFGGYNYSGFVKGPKSRRGMTEFSTSNDINNKSHLSQPLQNSPRHLFHTQNSPQHYAKLNKHLIHANDQQVHQFNNHLNHQLQQHNNNNNNNKHNQQTLPLDSSASNIKAISPSSATNGAAITPSPITSATHSPQHYRNPSNSPNNSPFAHAYYGENQQQQQLQNTTTATTAHHNNTPHQRQYHHLQQHLRGNNRWPLLTQAQQQQYLNDLLLQQQHLQQQKQQLLSSKHDDEELSEESLKQNVAIVLNNLDRYNNALRSIILNEQVSGGGGGGVGIGGHNSTTASGCIYFDDNLLINDDDDNVDDDYDYQGSCNNNFLLNAIENINNKMAAAATAAAAAATPESDYNSNATTPGSRVGNMLPHDSNALQQQQNVVGGGGGGVAVNGFRGVGNVGVGGGGNNGINGFCSFGNNVASNNLNCSLASSHDFTHDNSDYQWFLDYGYRDGCGGMQRSVLSSLSASYNGFGDLIYYEDLAKNLDANLAEVDMESFRAEDIHSLLSQLPSYCKSLGSGNSRLQHSLLMQQQQQHQLMYSNMAQHNGHNISQTSTTSTNELIDNSICKSELLFSPVKESHISVDSLDMDAYPDEGDIILTCKANKDNYTIAFEGSVLYSDDSFYEPNEISMKNKQNFINLHSNLEDIVKRKSLEVSMSRSEQAFTLQKSSTMQLQRYPSGNNNTSDAIAPIMCQAPHCLVRKSNSLPNINECLEQQKPGLVTKTCAFMRDLQEQLNVSHAVSTTNMTDCCKQEQQEQQQQQQQRNLLPMCQLPMSVSNSNSASISERLTPQKQLQQQQLQLLHRHKHRCCCSHTSAASHNSSSSTTTTANTLQQLQQQQQQYKSAHISGSASSGNSSNPPAFNLVKLFIKQKSSNCVSDDAAASAHTCMDVSSGCWPSSEAAGSSSSSSLEQRLRKKSMNDSGKGSALSRHEEEEDNKPIGDDSAFHLNNDGVALAEYSTPKRTHLPVATMSTQSPTARRRSIPLRHPQLCQLAVEPATSLQSSEGSRSNSEQLTQIQVSTGVVEQKRLLRHGLTQQTSHASSTDMVTRSMQTSCGNGSSLSARSSLSERFRCVPPSFLAKLNNLGAERQAPIYVIYPNYALPDLGFVKTHASSTDVIFSPFNYKMAVGSGSGSTTGSIASLKKRFSLNADDDEILKTMDYKHIEDWDSLATLLPTEYRKRLKHIPQVSAVMRELGSESSQRPLFCMTPPIRRSRSNVCDCAQYFQQQQQQLQRQQTQEEATSSSGSSQQPSSGYRGSSTLLTDESQLDGAVAVDPLQQMYVYQYEQQRMDSGVELSPAVGKAPLQPRPRGILRKSSSVTTRAKRSSMIEAEQSKLTKLEKRRSLQEPPYPHTTVGSSEEHLYDVFEEETITDVYAVPQPRKERLSRKDLDARARAENFLSSLPRSELKYYAEIASILESSEDHVQYDAAALKKEVSRVLSQQKKVSFNDDDVDAVTQQQQQLHQQQHLDKRQQRFSTPPNSPIISVTNGLRMHNASTTPRRCAQAEQQHPMRKIGTTIDEKEQRKIDSNRFKRLQIQWELMSKDSSMLKELASAQETKSGGSTPTTATAALKSRIPRPVSYPAGRRAIKSKSVPNLPEKCKETKIHSVSPKIVTRINAQDACGKTAGTRSPSRIVPPKRYSIGAATAASTTIGAPTTPSPTKGIGGTIPTTPTSATTRARTPNSRVAVTAPNTPKRRVQSPRRTISKVR